MAMVAAAALGLAGCGGGDAPGQEPSGESQGAGFGGPSLAGLCEDADVDIDDEPQAATPEEAVDLFVQDHSVLSDTTIEDTQILYDGEVVGSLVISQASAGGYYVSRAEWCYSE